MRITFDPAKNARNIAERSLPFDRVADLNWETAAAVEDDRRDYGERRLRVMALLGQRLHVTVITFRGDAMHVISFRKANSREIKRYGDEKDDAASRPDDESPEWTRKDFERARPALPLVGEIFGAEAAQAIARRRGRPRKASPKVNQTLRLDADVLEAYRRQGRGWQTRINTVLRAHMNDPRK